jgi:RHS repeat-associated protein
MPAVKFILTGLACVLLLSLTNASALVYGPDRSGTYGGAGGIGGIEAVVTETGGVINGVTNNYFGDAMNAPGSTTRWSAVVGGYGAMPGSTAVNANLQPQWRGKYIDPTGFYYMGARYYEPNSGRFLSADPLGHAASMDLYSYANGDPVNGLDPDGRLGKNAIEDVYNGGPGADLLNAGGNYLQGIASNAPNSTLAFSESYVGGIFNEVGGVNLHNVVNSATSFGGNVNTEYQQAGLYDASAYALTSWNVGAIESSIANVNPITGQPVGNGLDRLQLGLSGVAGTTAVVAPVEGLFNKVAEPGVWISTNESMSARAASYQQFVTGADPGQAYLVNGVKFDGFSGGTLLDAKGPGYATFVNSAGEFKPFFNGADSLLDQAGRQIEAAQGVPIQWHVAEPQAASAMRNLLQNAGHDGIDVIHTPQP